jgi:hypothetical protein
MSTEASGRPYRHHLRRVLGAVTLTASVLASTSPLVAAIAGPPVPVVTPGPAPVMPLLAGPRVVPRWRNPEPWAGAPPAILVTSLPTDAAGDIANIAWLRASRTELGLYPGTSNPGPGPYPRGPEQVPLIGRSSLVSTFNGGFYEKDSPAGFFVHKTLYAPMVRGLATVIGYANGAVDVVQWTGAGRPGTDVVVARQNLPLLVTNGRIAAGVNVSTTWGQTLGGVPAVWRSALGIDSNGNLMYAAAPHQTAPSLARLMVHAGAVRAMELDINPAWPILTTFGGPMAAAPSLVVQNPNQVATRFLSPGIKDFFAIYLRTTIDLSPAPF